MTHFVENEPRIQLYGAASVVELAGFHMLKQTRMLLAALRWTRAAYGGHGAA
jgi:hypothetical protein